MYVGDSLKEILIDDCLDWTRWNRQPMNATIKPFPYSYQLSRKPYTDSIHRNNNTNKNGMGAVHKYINNGNDEKYHKLQDPQDDSVGNCLHCYVSYRQHCEFKTEKAKGIEEHGPWSTHDSYKYGKVVCPKLWFSKCPKCGATGDRAHPLEYCMGDEQTAADIGFGVDIAGRPMFFKSRESYQWMDVGNLCNFENKDDPTKRKKCCSFCYGLHKDACEKAGEMVPSKDDDGPWSSHSLMFNKIVRCPLLWFNVCQRCGATGDHGHTLKHCPENNHHRHDSSSSSDESSHAHTQIINENRNGVVYQRTPNVQQARQVLSQRDPHRQSYIYPSQPVYRLVQVMEQPHHYSYSYSYPYFYNHRNH